ncbi:MAG: HU family DNA-binding protein [Myxococcales bacterium]|nr:HU family DNA-binding protein [Myxococcales bacterium]
MTKAELIDAVRGAQGVNLTKKDTEVLVNALFEAIKKAIAKDKRFSYPGFGTFSIRARKQRKGRNPRTGDEITIKASKTVGFKPAPKFKDMV